MNRMLRACTVVAALTPVALVASMLSQVPPSALAVPKVQIASAAGAGLALNPEALGARRTANGLQIERRTLDRTVRRLAENMAVPPKAGGYVMTPQGVVLDRGTPGSSLDIARARDMLVSALRSPGADLVLPVVQVPPPAPPPFAIIVRLSEFRLLLYEETQLRKTYPVGVGALKFPTPPGVYYIRSKDKNPTWRNPGSAWARSMPRVVPPGPRNPLGTRALRLDRGALVIHGTPQPSTVGRRSSHGCIRMYKADVEELFEIVPARTPVFIIP